MHEVLMQAQVAARPRPDGFLLAVLGVCVGIVLAGPMVDWVKTRVLAGFSTTQTPTEEQVAVMVILVWLFLPLVLLVALAAGVGKGLAYVGRGVRDWGRTARDWYGEPSGLEEARDTQARNRLRNRALDQLVIDPDLEAARREVDAIAPETE
jgi:hypothetical protein